MAKAKSTLRIEFSLENGSQLGILHYYGLNLQKVFWENGSGLERNRPCCCVAPKRKQAGIVYFIRPVLPAPRGINSAAFVFK
jgi:hypothetical protein